MSIPQVTPITGLPQVSGWSQVITHPSRLLTCVLSVAGKNANSVGKTLAEHIAHFPTDGSSALHNSLLDLLQSARAEECRLQLACILLTDNKNILATYEGAVFLRRSHKTGQILTSEGELKIIEGSQVEGDVFVLATHQAANAFPELKNILHRETEDIVPQLVTELHSKENSSLSAFAWVELKPNEEAELSPTLAIANTPRKGFSLSSLFASARNLIPSAVRGNPLFIAKKAASRIKNFVAAIQHKEEPMIGGPTKFRPRVFFIGAGAIILILALTIVWKRHQINQEIQVLQPRFGELQQQLVNAQTIASDQPIEARAQVREVMRGLEDLIAANPDKKEAIKRLKEEYQNAQNFADSISGTQNQGTLEPFFDLRLAEASFVAKSMTLAGNTIIALDASGQRLVILDTQSKQTQQIPLENIGTARAITAGENAAYVLADGIHSYELEDPHTHVTLKETGDSDRNGTQFGSFTSYLYVLNPDSRNIFRYLQQDDTTVSDPVGWLVDKQGLDFGALSSMAIDGDLWLADNTGQIFKYTQGRQQSFVVGDMPTAFHSSLQLATHPDTDTLFVLESAQHRLVVLKKDGSFFKEIVSDSLGSAQAVVASPTENAAYVVSGSLVYKISL